MLTFMLWLIFTIFTLLAFGWTFPEETVRIIRKLRRYLHQRYTKRHGQEATDRDIPLDT